MTALGDPDWQRLDCFLYFFILPELCLLGNVQGGFEVDALVKVKEAVPVGASPGKTRSKLQKGTNDTGLTGILVIYYVISTPHLWMHLKRQFTQNENSYLHLLTLEQCWL